MKKLFYSIGLLLACLLLSGCEIEAEEAKEGPQQESGYCFYYLDAGETELKKETYTPQEETNDFMVKDLMQRLGRKAKEGKESNLLPDEVTINSYELRDGELVIDFNGEYNNMSRAREILVRAGVVKTFLQIPEISAVRFTVDGKDLLNFKNEKVGAMTADTFADYSEKDIDAYQYDTFTLYFTDSAGEKLREEQRSIYYKRSLSKEKVVLEQLAKGPMAKGNYPTLAGDAAALDIITADGICYVNMNSSIRDYELNVSEEAEIYSIVNSLVASCGIEKVQIIVDGNTDGYFKENIPVYSFLTFNDSIVVSAEDAE